MITVSCATNMANEINGAILTYDFKAQSKPKSSSQKAMIKRGEEGTAVKRH